MYLKAGDLVVCISNKPNRSYQPNPWTLARLQEGAYYRVASYSSAVTESGQRMFGVTLVGVDHAPGQGWQAWRFRKVVKSEPSFTALLPICETERRTVERAKSSWSGTTMLEGAINFPDHLKPHCTVCGKPYDQCDAARGEILAVEKHKREAPNWRPFGDIEARPASRSTEEVLTHVSSQPDDGSDLPREIGQSSAQWLGGEENAGLSASRRKGACPFGCGKDDCEHLLLSVDVTFREAAGGALFGKFQEHWSTLCENDDLAFDEQSTFENLLEQVSAVSQDEASIDFQAGPGQSCGFELFYHRNAIAVAEQFGFKR